MERSVRNEEPVYKNSSSHGTSIFKFVAASSTSNSEIHFIPVGNTNFNHFITFYRVAKALEYIIDSTKNQKVVHINCSFSLPALQDS